MRESVTVHEHLKDFSEDNHLDGSRGAGYGGQRPYEPALSRECRNGVIDDAHAPVWKNILSHQRGY